MAFMEPVITSKIDWLSLDTNCGIYFVPLADANVNREQALQCLDNDDKETIKELLVYTEGTELHEVEIIHGYGIRLSANGYMDCTDWGVYANKREAIKALRELGGNE